MALDALRCNHFAPLGFKGLIYRTYQYYPLVTAKQRVVNSRRSAWGRD